MTIADVVDDMLANFSDLLAEDVPFARENPENYVAWREFVARPDPKKPLLPSMGQYQAMSDAEKASYDLARKMYHNTFGPLTSRTMKKVHDQVIRLAWDNLRTAPGARQGAIVDGQATLGKTTIVLHMGRIYEGLAQRAYEGKGLRGTHVEFIPVVYSSVPSSTTPKKLLQSLNKFYGNPFADRDSEAKLKSRLHDIAVQCGTSLFILDDIHNLHRGNKSADSVNDLIKELANLIPATFVYAGINCEDSVLLMDSRTGGKGRFTQTQYRFALHKVEPFPYDVHLAGESEWLEFLASVEEHLCLLKYRPGWLVQQERYLYLRTEGGIGSLIRLVRAAANAAIRDGSESLTRAGLEGIRLAEGAERYYAEKKAALAAIKDSPEAVARLLNDS